MEINMPYGAVCINNREDALRFLKQMCHGCCNYDTCSAAQSKKCEQKKEDVIDFVFETSYPIDKVEDNFKTFDFWRELKTSLGEAIKIERKLKEN